MLIAMDNLTISYQYRPAVHHLSGTFDRGRVFALMGPNGGGKSSLMRCIKGELPPSNGTIQNCCTKIGFLPQKPLMRRDCPLCVYDIVTSGLWNRFGWFSSIHQQLQHEIEEVLHNFNLEDLAYKNIGDLSEGQFRRTLLARLALEKVELYMLDEPFDHLDLHGENCLIDMILRWKAAGKAVIVSLHDYNLATKIADEVIILARELILWDKMKSLSEDAYKEKILNHQVQIDSQPSWCKHP